ncbi:MAG TPA: phosphoglycerate mutase family protein [Flavobacteriales bacterium]
MTLRTSPFVVPFLVLSALFGCASHPATRLAQDGSTTIYLVRHAEKLDPHDPDTPLSPVGEQRAKDLATTLAKSGVRAIYATDRIRTQRTVAPLAALHGIEVIVLRAEDTAGLVERITTQDKGKVVVVAGHSNTVPGIVKALSGITVDGLSEEQFDRLFKVVLPPDGTPEVTVLRYGAETP